MKKRNVAHKDLMKKLLELERTTKKASRLAIFTIGVAFIAMTVPLIMDMLEMPDWAKSFIVLFYFGIGVYVIFSEYYKISEIK